MSEMISVGLLDKNGRPPLVTNLAEKLGLECQSQFGSVVKSKIRGAKKCYWLAIDEIFNAIVYRIRWRTQTRVTVLFQLNRYVTSIGFTILLRNSRQNGEIKVVMNTTCDVYWESALRVENICHIAEEKFVVRQNFSDSDCDLCKNVKPKLCDLCWEKFRESRRDYSEELVPTGEKILLRGR